MFANRIAGKISALCICFGFSALNHEAVAAPSVAPASKSTTVKRYQIEQFMATTSLGGASFSADEKRVLFHSNVSGIFNAYTLPVIGGNPVALTKSTTDTTLSVSFFPNDRLFSGAAPKPDALFCGNDQIARGVVEALRELGIGVPKDVSIVRFAPRIV